MINNASQGKKDMPIKTRFFFVSLSVRLRIKRYIRGARNIRSIKNN